MNREHAMIRYAEETTALREEYRIRMSDHLLERSERLEELVKGAMGQLAGQMEKEGKEYVSFLYLSRLRTDLIQRKSRFLLTALDIQWYLDENPIELYVDAEDLFEPLFSLWNDLTEAGRKYIGAVNPYDIQQIVFEELKYMDVPLCQILRYCLRDWEQKEIFAGVALFPYWLLRWGEYRDQAEFILQTDRRETGKRVFREELKKSSHKPETMVFSYWYQMEVKDSQADQVDMRFLVFEDCSLSEVSFRQCNMEGARFTGSRLTNCSFEDSRLLAADFTGCSFDGVSFQGAELNGAMFPAESVAFLNLDPEQLQVILLKREDNVCDTFS